MNIEQIIEDAEKAGFKLRWSNNDAKNRLSHCGYYIDAELIKFAQLQAARQSNHSEAVEPLLIIKHDFKDVGHGVDMKMYMGTSFEYKGKTPLQYIPNNTPLYTSSPQTTDILEEAVKDIENSYTHFDSCDTETAKYNEGLQDAANIVRNRIKQPESEGK